VVSCDDMRTGCHYPRARRCIRHLRIFPTKTSGQTACEYCFRRKLVIGLLFIRPLRPPSQYSGRMESVNAVTEFVIQHNFRDRLHGKRACVSTIAESSSTECLISADFDPCWPEGPTRSYNPPTLDLSTLRFGDRTSPACLCEKGPPH